MQFTSKDGGAVSVINLLMQRTPFLPIHGDHRCPGNMKHEVRAPGSDANTKVPFLRHHVRHGAGFRYRKFVLRDRGNDVFTDLCFGQSGQYQPRPIHRVRKNCPYRSRVITNRPKHFRVPESGTVEWIHPRSFNQAGKPIFAINCRLEAALLKDENSCIA